MQQAHVGGGFSLGSLTIHQTILVKPFQEACCHSKAKELSHVTKHASHDDSDSVTKSGLKAGEQFCPSCAVLKYLRTLKPW